MTAVRDRLSRLLPGGRSDHLRERYVALLERAVLHTLYDPTDRGEPPQFAKEAMERAVRESGARFTMRAPQRARAEGRDWPVYAPTMVGAERLRNVRRCVEAVLADRVPGDLIEAGCWRGGVGILMRGILEAHRDRSRSVWMADSFEGLPAPNEQDYPHDAGDRSHTVEQLAVSVEKVRAAFRRFGLLDDRVRFLEGWFSQTLPRVRERSWAVVRLDGDLYESTMDGLVNLYPGLSVGGFLIIDDYALPACRAAVHDFRREHRIAEEIEPIDWTGVYWRRRE